MARSRSRRSDSAPSVPASTSGNSPAPGTTGAFIVTYQPGASEAVTQAFSDRAGIEVFSVGELGEEPIPQEELASPTPNLNFPDWGIAVVSGEQAQMAALAAAPEDTGIIDVRPELIMEPFPDGGFPFPEGQSPIHGIPGIGTAPFIPFPGMPFPGIPGNGVLNPGMNPRMFSSDYLQGFRNGVNSLIDGLLQQNLQSTRGIFTPAPIGAVQEFGTSLFQESAIAFEDTQQSTWGLKATGVMDSTLSGDGVKVCILDTGIDLTHPDFQGRNIFTQSFVPSPMGGFLNVQDQLGHGTHCAGTACGPRVAANGGPRYGVAYEADIFFGRVFDNAGGAQERWILAGIRWAVQQGCRIISLSLGTPWERVPVAPPKVLMTYEQLAEQVLNSTAIIAAVGNESNRPGSPGFNPARPQGVKPVAIPANSTKIMGVGAVDRNMQLAAFSNRSFFPGAGAVDIVGPGFGVYSAWPVQTQWGRYNVIGGTSMATPHVAGIAALIAQARPNWTGRDILNGLLFLARPLSLSSADAGKGLVFAPVSD